MKNILILTFVYLSMQIGSMIIFDHFYDLPSVIFLVGYFTYPLIKYLQS
jgi:hypothetical protein